MNRWMEPMSDLVDKFYTQVDGLKFSEKDSVYKIDYLIVCNQPTEYPEDKINHMISNGLMTKLECFEIQIYLRQIKNEIANITNVRSDFIDMIKPLDELNLYGWEVIP